ncbi:MAG: cobyrinate a,c-diamide synthase [Anaerolineaceae bacterium]|nr:cobyrinate a,c-diamide synthase [Anaerolineaceae bacterium]
MICQIPRILIAGTGSGCGKTTITCAVMKALVNRDLKVGAFKCGPDYIDPMFHGKIVGSPSTNLDTFFFSENVLNALLARNAAGKDISVIEGVMGYYDGLGMDSVRSSTYETASLTRSPVILVLNAKGCALSMLAVLQGFLTFAGDSCISGVIFNRCSPQAYPVLAEAVRSRFGDIVSPLGFLPDLPGCSLESRHLGLVTADETEDLNEKMDTLAAQAEKTIDLDRIIQMANAAPPVICEPLAFPASMGKLRIAVAMDKAFCFYYHDNLDALQDMGAEIVPFSPLSDPELPGDIHGLYIGGGYPELYTKELSANRSLLHDLRRALDSEMPCIAECGGYMLLTRSIENAPMVGFLPGNCYNTGRITRFGYIILKPHQDSLLFRKDEEIPAHEFHYWDCEDPGSGLTALKSSGKHWRCGFTGKTFYAGFPHFHFYAKPETAVRFMEACVKYKRSRND